MGYTSLHVAAMEGHTHVVVELIGKDADVDKVKNWFCRLEFSS